MNDLKIFFGGLVAVVLCVVFLSSPVQVEAAGFVPTAQYNAMSANEKIAFLYGMIAQLQSAVSNKPYTYTYSSYYGYYEDDYDDVVVIPGHRSSNSNSRYNDDFELSIDDTRVRVGEEVDIDWEIPSRDTGSRNWIGLYERGDSNRDYIDRERLDDDNDGTEHFVIRKRGTYEFRLFLDDSYDDEITSARIEVY